MYTVEVNDEGYFEVCIDDPEFKFMPVYFIITDEMMVINFWEGDELCELEMPANIGFEVFNKIPKMPIREDDNQAIELQISSLPFSLVVKPKTKFIQILIVPNDTDEEVMNPIQSIFMSRAQLNSYENAIRSREGLYPENDWGNLLMRFLNKADKEK